MLLVKTYLDKSAIEGLGLFAAEGILKGDVIWKWDPILDLRFPKEALRELKGPALQTFLKYSYLSKRSGLYILCFDDGRFINHSDKPNVAHLPCPLEAEDADVAARDIAIGEELVCDYRAFDDEAQIKLR